MGPAVALPPYPYYPPQVVVGGVARTADRLRLPRLDTDERHEAVRASGTYLKKSYE